MEKKAISQLREILSEQYSSEILIMNNSDLNSNTKSTQRDTEEIQKEIKYNREISDILAKTDLPFIVRDVTRRRLALSGYARKHKIKYISEHLEISPDEVRRLTEVGVNRLREEIKNIKNNDEHILYLEKLIPKS